MIRTLQNRKRICGDSEAQLKQICATTYVSSKCFWFCPTILYSKNYIYKLTHSLHWIKNVQFCRDELTPEEWIQGIVIINISCFKVKTHWCACSLSVQCEKLLTQLEFHWKSSQTVWSESASNSSGPTSVITETSCRTAQGRRWSQILLHQHLSISLCPLSLLLYLVNIPGKHD